MLDDKAFLDLLYGILLEREADPVGVADWQQKLESGQLTRHQVAVKFIASAEFQAKTGLFRDAFKRLNNFFSDLVSFDVFGAKLLVPKGSDAYNELSHGGYEPWVLPYFYELCQPGMVVLDIGASLGNFAIPAAKKVGPDGTVFAVEASEKNARLLLLNAFKNELTNIKVLPIGVSDEVGLALLPLQNYTNNNVLASSVGLDVQKIKNCTLVPLLPLDVLLDHVPRLDIVKMDIEGMEYRALMGARAVIDRTRPIIFVEYSPRFQKAGSGVEGRKLLLQLLRAGYRAEILHRSRATEKVDSPNPDRAAEVIDAAWQHHVSQEGGSHLDLCFLPKDGALKNA